MHAQMEINGERWFLARSAFVPGGHGQCLETLLTVTWGREEGAPASCV